jgi:hypothetical protein
MPLRRQIRRWYFGLNTLFGRRRGFFIPYRYADRLPAPGRRPTYGAVCRLLDRYATAFAEQLDNLGTYRDDLLRIGRDPAPAPRWDQDWFPRLDAAVAYGLVRRYRPARIVEVGSGHSTRFLARAVRDGNLPTRILAIDPAPRAPLGGLPVEWLAAPVPGCGGGPFQALAAGDILFIDSSHVLMPGSDVDFLLNDVLPALPAGVLVHVHDIFLPDDYPEAWAWRGYNEQPAVAPFVYSGWTAIFASHYAATRMTERVRQSVAGELPLPAGAFETSLWIARRDA